MKPASIFLGVLLSWATKTVKPINAVRETATGSRSPAGPRRLGAATRISASLLRRLSAFFGSTLGQGPKAAKYTFLIPGPGMFVNVRNVPRVVIAPPSETPPVSPCEPLCAILLAKASVYPLSPVKTNVSRLCECDLKPLRRGLSHAIWDVASAVWTVIGGTYL